MKLAGISPACKVDLYASPLGGLLSKTFELYQKWLLDFNGEF